MTTPTTDPAVAACAAGINETAILHDLLVEILGNARSGDTKWVLARTADALDTCDRLTAILELET
ncbi:hypothetical protein [Roseospira visakhapatnamensis]|uniref:Uncharacterized protein n=1 Tax=Roseospira visakhapatnamensis TaxID=390880 RepID=A0A7W6W8G3_9PROT|nr:hypothetical protein [Roseospira visakhapatnamensis]MBB4264798.1 hypothetical protein [Roseospira visakhapatnamensis]